MDLFTNLLYFEWHFFVILFTKIVKHCYLKYNLILRLYQEKNINYKKNGVS